jgi:hypothetical protein
MKSMQYTVAKILLTSLVALGAACGDGTYLVPRPTERLAASEAAIRGARELGAEQDERAARYLEYAYEEVAAARSRMEAGENGDAEMLLRRARADLELAVMLTHEKAATNEAQMAYDQLEAAKRAR